MTYDDIRLFGIEEHVETINFIAGLIADFARINSYEVADIIPLLHDAADAIADGTPLDGCTLREVTP